jgi:alpha/beta hydrolase fold
MLLQLITSTNDDEWKFEIMDLVSALLLALMCSIKVQIRSPGPGVRLDGTVPAGIIFVLLVIIISFLIMGFGRIAGYAKTTFYHAQQGLALRTKDGRHISFPDLCKAVIPPCRLNPFVFNGHLQTMWTVIKSQDIPIYYKRKIFENEDPTYIGTFAVDFVVRPYEGEDSSLPPRTTYLTEQEFANIGSLDSKPMLVTLHGLSGGSHEVYLRHVLAPLVSDVGGWEACVVNSRGCAKSKITSSVLYNARATWDVRQTVKWLRKQFPNRPLFGIGFSLGANILTNVCIPCAIQTSGMIETILTANSTLAKKAQNVF